MTATTQTELIAYDATGRITMVASLSQATLELYQSSGMGLLLDTQADPDTQMVVNGVVQDRPANPTTLNGAVLSNVPVPAVVVINGASYSTNESTVELGLTMGTYAVKVEAFPYLDKQFTVTV